MDYCKDKSRRRMMYMLCRIEKKCDGIISELRALRQCHCNKATAFDETIDRMHRNARRMRDAASRDAELIRKLFRQRMME